MPWAAPRVCHVPGHPPYRGDRCPLCRGPADRARKREYDRTRPSARQRGYDDQHQRDRAQFLAANPFCIVCGAPATVLEHRTPHRGDQRLLRADWNWQAMCASCASRKTATQDSGFARRRAR